MPKNFRMKLLPEGERRPFDEAWKEAVSCFREDPTWKVFFPPGRYFRSAEDRAAFMALATPDLELNPLDCEAGFGLTVYVKSEVLDDETRKKWLHRRWKRLGPDYAAMFREGFDIDYPHKIIE